MEIVHYGGDGYETPDTPECSMHKLSNNDCNPYDEPQPFVRGRVDRNGYKTGYSSIDRDNILLQRKLKEIRTRNNAYAAKETPETLQSSCSQPQLSWQSFVHHTAHTASRGKSPQKARAQEIAACNAVMAKKLSELYAIRKDSFVVQNHLGKGLDCNERWQLRTGMYSCGCRSGAGIRSSSSGSRPSTAPAAGCRSSGMRSSSRPASACGSTAAGSGNSTGVPKTLGVALCAGCGCRSFFNADGAQLQPCPGCGHAFYCSDACRQFDYPSHKAECRFHTTGRWHAAGIRPSEDCWVVNRAMTAARRLLQQQQQQQQQQHRQRNSSSSRPGTAHAPNARRRTLQGSCSSQRRCKSAQTSIYYQQQEAYAEWDRDHVEETGWQHQLQQQLEDVRLQEQQEVLAQQQVELRASQGLDGPRPCLCSNGLEQLGGRVHKSAAAQTRGASGSSAGGSASRRAVGSGRTWRGGKAWKGVHEA